MTTASRPCGAKSRRASTVARPARSTGTASWNESSAPKAMRNITVRPAAEADIDNAADYTIEQWGIEQARHYIGDIRRAIERLAMDGLRHPKEADVLPGLRRARSGHHFIFYLIDDEQVDVIRVLHERRDATRQLKG
ncbi:type II toxin-antitoxin system RelE/ParE family toxin [Sphingopyxis sp. MG]|nr:type II toxin-antitoxin system RelE/ParE family toxin [Sphingopyxis sp. MG]